jgi:hypothetical protein
VQAPWVLSSQASYDAEGRVSAGASSVVPSHPAAREASTVQKAGARLASHDSRVPHKRTLGTNDSRSRTAGAGGRPQAGPEGRVEEVVTSRNDQWIDRPPLAKQSLNYPCRGRVVVWRACDCVPPARRRGWKQQAEVAVGGPGRLKELAEHVGTTPLHSGSCQWSLKQPRAQWPQTGLDVCPSLDIGVSDEQARADMHLEAGTRVGPTPNRGRPLLPGPTTGCTGAPASR